MKISPIPALKDNYIWALHDEQSLAVVDPAEAEPVLKFIQKHQLNLTTILITHHHHDHTGGIAGLLEAFPNTQVYAPASEQVICAKHKLQQPDVISISQPNCKFAVLDVAGHTAGHIAYLSEGALFCGDALFHAGCGRLFEGDAHNLQNTMNKLAHLPGETLIYCGHEYSQANLEFAATVEPDNQNIQLAIAEVQRKLSAGLPSLPSSIAEQKQLNPFLRANSATIKTSLEQHFHTEFNSELAILAGLRKWKDVF